MGGESTKESEQKEIDNHLKKPNTRKQEKWEKIFVYTYSLFTMNFSYPLYILNKVLCLTKITIMKKSLKKWEWKVWIL